ncbi:uncharacterized protein LOC115921576 [Strongylocentrotus purpuratus]|uniref:Uncharacterized protein n=1 Tax=Strongylocentrotus purpuratus TaxID=7668 RepID=A0A7M7ND78_STRPU|nr:uncharacterized protein LOC115921576 [Strongylocentrotus purpuratus]
MVRKSKRLRPGKNATRTTPVSLPVKTCPCICDTSDDSVSDGGGAPLLGSTSKTSAELPDKEKTGTTDSTKYQGLIPDKRPMKAPRRNLLSTEHLPITVEVALKEHPTDADDAFLSAIVPSAALPDEEEDDNKVSDLGRSRYVGLIPDSHVTTPESLREAFLDDVLPMTVEAETPHEDTNSLH